MLSLGSATKCSIHIVLNVWIVIIFMNLDNLAIEQACPPVTVGEAKVEASLWNEEQGVIWAVALVWIHSLAPIAASP